MKYSFVKEIREMNLQFYDLKNLLLVLSNMGEKDFKRVYERLKNRTDIVLGYMPQKYEEEISPYTSILSFIFLSKLVNIPKFAFIGWNLSFSVEIYLHKAPIIFFSENITLFLFNILYIYEGSGNHELKEYFKDDKIVKPAISSVISFHLENFISLAAPETMLTFIDL